MTITNRPEPQLLETERDEADPYIRVLVYGGTGVGKTRLVCSAEQVPEMAPCIVWNFDKGTGSVTWPIKQIKLEKWKQVQEALKRVKDGPYKTLVLDDVTELYNVCLQEAIRQSKIDAAAHNRQHDPDVPEQRDYQKAHAMFLKLIRELRDTPIHLLATAKETYSFDRVTERFLGTFPWVSGQLNVLIASFFAVVGYLEVNSEGKVEMHVERSNRFKTKDRHHVIPDPGVLEEPTMAEVYGYHYPPKGGETGKKKK